MMTIQYALTRSEIAGGFFRSLGSSPKYRRTILLYALLPGVAILAVDGILNRQVTVQDIITALVPTAAFAIFVPLMLYIRGKTSQRILTISTEGISTQIGSIKGEIPWKKIAVISDGNHFILVGRTNGNAFFIPSRAFSSPEHQAEFVAEVRNFLSL